MQKTCAIIVVVSDKPIVAPDFGTGTLTYGNSVLCSWPEAGKTCVAVLTEDVDKNAFKELFAQDVLNRGIFDGR